MISTNAVFTDLVLSPEAALHSYGTAEDLPIEFPTIQRSGDRTECYRAAWGLYCTGESGMWTLSPENLQQFFQLQSFGVNWPLTFTVERASPMPPPEKLTQADQLLGRIRARRTAIQAQRGILTESYLLIREDRER